MFVKIQVKILHVTIKILKTPLVYARRPVILLAIMLISSPYPIRRAETAQHDLHLCYQLQTAVSLNGFDN